MSAPAADAVAADTAVTNSNGNAAAEDNSMTAKNSDLNPNVIDGAKSDVTAGNTAITSTAGANELKQEEERRKKERKEWHEVVKGDEFAYLIGVSNLVFSAWLCGAFPAGYWVYHCLKLAWLLVFRFYSWTKKKWSFFLTEYCYVINYVLLLYYLLSYFKGAWFRSVFPFQKSLFRMLFSAASGPLAASVIIQGNRLVFHDIELFTIVSVHLSPSIALWGMRWFPDLLQSYFPDVFETGCQGKQFDLFDPTFTSNCGDSAYEIFKDVTIYPCLFHALVWAVPYFILMFVVERKNILENKYRNCYDDFLKDHPGLAKQLGHSFLELKYMIGHNVFCTTFFLINQLLFRSFHLHTLYLLVIFAISIHNGGYYYFEIFLDKYKKDMQAKREKMK